MIPIDEKVTVLTMKSSFGRHKDVNLKMVSTSNIKDQEDHKLFDEQIN